MVKKLPKLKKLHFWGTYYFLDKTDDSNKKFEHILTKLTKYLFKQKLKHVYNQMIQYKLL